MQPQDVVGFLFVIVAPFAIMGFSTWLTVWTSKSIGVTKLANSASGLLAAKTAQTRTDTIKSEFDATIAKAAKTLGIPEDKLREMLEAGQLTIGGK